MPRHAKQFIFEGFSVGFDRGMEAFFRYRVVMEDGTTETYEEKLCWPTATAADWARVPEPLQKSLLQTLHLALGISYWKMDLAREISLNGFSLTKEQGLFWETIYTNGMGEFYYKNQIDFRGLVHFPTSDMAVSSSTSVDLPDRHLAALGGGKDSYVTVELLKDHQMNFDLFQLGRSVVQEAGAAHLGKVPVIVERRVDPRMVELSKSGVVLNGHIPISVIYAFLGVASAIILGYRSVIFSNESSASVGNVSYLGMEINHQWSKSIACERLIQQYLRDVLTPSVQMFSLLRPFSELEIVRRFTQHPEHFSFFSSCNRNFVISKDQPRVDTGLFWCGACPKCAFVFLALSAFLPKEKLVAMFGKNLFADESLVKMYRELLGMESLKPFECVGTVEDCAVAFEMAHEQGTWEDDVAMKMFVTDARPTMKDLADWKRRVFEKEEVDTIPEEFRFTQLPQPPLSQRGGI